MPGRLGDRFAKWLVRLLPVDVREAHGGDIEQVLRTTNRERRQGAVAGVTFWLSAVADMLRAALPLHLEAFVHDVRYTWRNLQRSPAFAAAALITIALGTGATLAVFVVVNGVLIRPLPFADPDRVMLIWAVNPEGSRTWLSAPELDDLSSRASTLESVAGLTDLRFALTGSGDPEELNVAGASAGLFPLLGIGPHVGRLFDSRDDLTGAARVVVLSHGLWTRKFGSSPAVLGGSIALDGRPYTIVGVLPPAFEIVPPSAVFPRRVDAWVALQPHLISRARDVRYLHAVGRLRRHVSLDTARHELQATGAAVSDDYSSAYRGRRWAFDVVPMQEDVVRGVRPALLVLLGTVLLVLVLASVNVGALLLARSGARRREMAVRAALGASRARLMRQLLTEGFVLAGLGGVLGLCLAGAAPAIARVSAMASLPRFSDLSIDWRVLACAAAAATLTAAIFALAPAFELSGPGSARSSDALRSSTRPPHAVRATRLLAASEVALASTVLVLALLFARTLASLLDIDPGFSTVQVATARVSLPPSYSTAAQITRFFDDAIERLRATVGVEEAGAVTQLPLSGAALGSSFSADGAPPDASGVDVDLRGVAAGYFATLKIPLLRGRDFTPADTHRTSAVAVIDEITARRLWPDRDAIGQRIRWMRQPELAVEVVGIVGAVRHRGVTQPPRATVYRPHTQYVRPAMYLVARGQGDRPPPGAAIAEAVRAADPNQPLAEVASMASLRGRSFAQPGFGAALAGWLALLALALTAVGVYGLHAFAIAQRRREVGIRLAVGGTPGRVQALLLADGLRTTMAGLCVGLAAAVPAARWAQRVIPGGAAIDVSSVAIAGAVTLLVAAGACWIPAHRASRLDPTVVLRADP